MAKVGIRQRVVTSPIAARATITSVTRAEVAKRHLGGVFHTVWWLLFRLVRICGRSFIRYWGKANGVVWASVVLACFFHVGCQGNLSERKEAPSPEADCLLQPIAPVGQGLIWITTPIPPGHARWRVISHDKKLTYATGNTFPITAFVPLNKSCRVELEAAGFENYIEERKPTDERPVWTESAVLRMTQYGFWGFDPYLFQQDSFLEEISPEWGTPTSVAFSIAHVSDVRHNKFHPTTPSGREMINWGVLMDADANVWGFRRMSGGVDFYYWRIAKVPYAYLTEMIRIGYDADSSPLMTLGYVRCDECPSVRVMVHEPPNIRNKSDPHLLTMRGIVLAAHGERSRMRDNPAAERVLRWLLAVMWDIERTANAFLDLQ